MPQFQSIKEGDYLRFRCRVGHAYSTDSLLAEQSEALEDALWSALRALEESGALVHRMARRARENNQHLIATRYEERARSTQQQAELIQQVLLKGMSNNPDKSAPQET